MFITIDGCRMMVWIYLIKVEIKWKKKWKINVSSDNKDDQDIFQPITVD